jgi:hypothetical protein
MEDLPTEHTDMKSNAFTIHFVRVSILVSILCTVCSQVLAQDFKTLHPGVEYARVDYKIGNDPVKINLLRLDLKKVRLDVHHAFDKAIGVEPTSAIAKRHNAIAAINAGFFRLDKSEFAGDPAGIMQLDHRLVSESVNNRVAVAIFNRARTTTVDFGHAKTQTWLSISANFSSINIDAINREPKDNEVALYTPEFQRTPSTSKAVIEIVLDDCLHVCRKVLVSGENGGSPIPSRGYVVALYGDKRSLITDKLRSVLNDPSTRPMASSIIELQSGKGRRFGKAEDITNGVSMLIRDRRIDLTWEQEKASKSFAEMRHPRTAVAKLKDGKFLMVTVDGRQPGVSVGMTLKELADYLLSIGATDAMNLDGGGSTTMYVDGKVVNTPSDKEGERKVSDAIVVTLRNRASRASK